MTGAILLTGGAGFVGRVLAPRLRARFPDSRVVAAGLASPAGDDPHAVSFDLQDPASIEGVIASVRPRALVHLAAMTHVGEAQSRSDEVWRINALGSAHLAEAVLRLAPDCRFLHISSGDVYGVTANARERLTEDDTPRPANVYAVTKLAAEYALQEAQLRGLRLVRARPFNHTGPTQEPRFVVPRIVTQVAEIALGRREPVLRLGALDRSRDFLHVADVCDAYCEMLAKFDAIEPAGVLNIASGQPRTIQSVVDDVLELAGVDCEIVSEPSALRPYDVVQMCGDASRARSLLGWTPKIGWRELLQEMLALHMRQGGIA
jgi:GDP-4-dehydro-6-deoxy-D-mannose reductase